MTEAGALPRIWNDLAAGAAMFLRAGSGWALVPALIIVGVVAGVAALRSVHPADWQKGRRA